MADISYGSENAWNSATTTTVSVAMLDETHFVAAYYNGTDGKVIIGVTDGDTAISSYGTAVTFNSVDTNYISVAALDSTHFVVAYVDVGGDYYGHARIGVTSGTTISAIGTESDFNAAQTFYPSVAALDSTHFVVVYRDFGGDDYGMARVGVTNEASTVSSYGTAVAFFTGATAALSVAALDSTHFVVAHKIASGHGGAIVGVTSGTTISSFGSAATFNSAVSDYHSVAALDSTHFVVAYQDDGGTDEGIARIGLVSGTTISSYGAENVFNSAVTGYVSVAALDSTNFVVAYKDDGGDDYGGARVGTVSTTTISGYGDEALFNSAVTNYISVSALNTTDFVIGYQDAGNSSYGTGIVGSIASAAGPANLKTYNTVPKANLKTINTNPLSNCKSVNTII